MKNFEFVVSLIIFLLFFAGIGSALQAPGTEDESEYVWNGTWSTPDYIFTIKQDQSGITGEYVPTNLSLLDPGRVEGNVSEDGRTYSGVWIETGSNTYTLSNDKMSFAILGFADPYGNMTEPAYYTSNATRIGDIPDPDNPWSGSWVTWKKSYNLTQNGTYLSGINQPLNNVNDESGLLDGIISDDGTTYTGNWTEKGSFTFVMSDTGSEFNATITKSLEPTAIVEHMIFSK